MSYQATTAVTEHSRHSGSELLCLLMLANYASPDGTNIRPSVARLARDCRMSDRGVRYILAKLIESGELVYTGNHANNVKVYRISLPPFEHPQALQGLQGFEHQALQKRTPSPAIASSASPAIAVAENQLDQSRISQNGHKGYAIQKRQPAQPSWMNEAIADEVRRIRFAKRVGDNQYVDGLGCEFDPEPDLRRMLDLQWEERIGNEVSAD